MRVPVNLVQISKSGLQLRKERERTLVIQVFVEADVSDELIEAVRVHLTPTEAANVVFQVIETGNEKIDITADLIIGLVADKSRRMQAVCAQAANAKIPYVSIYDMSDSADVSRKSGVSTTDIVYFRDGSAELLLSELAAGLSDALPSKRLVLAHNFPFLRKTVALEFVRSTALQNAVVGGAVIIPGADMPVMTANQAKMVLQIAAAYGEEIGLSRAREILGVIGGALLMRAAARQMVGLVPGLGWAMKGGIAYAGTVAIGHAAIRYFERDGNALSLRQRLDEMLANKRNRTEDG